MYHKSRDSLCQTSLRHFHLRQNKKKYFEMSGIHFPIIFISIFRFLIFLHFINVTYKVYILYLSGIIN